MSKIISPNNTGSYPENIYHKVEEVDDSTIITWYDTQFKHWVADVVDIYNNGKVSSYAAESGPTEKDAIDEAISMYWEMDERNWIDED